MTTIQVRIDKKTKKQAQKILNEMGLDMSTAIKLYFKQIAINKGIPFRIITENGMTLEQELAILKASEEAKKGIGISESFDSPEELIKELKKK